MTCLFQKDAQIGCPNIFMGSPKRVTSLRLMGASCQGSLPYYAIYHGVDADYFARGDRQYCHPYETIVCEYLQICEFLNLPVSNNFYNRRVGILQQALCPASVITIVYALKKFLRRLSPASKSSLFPRTITIASWTAPDVSERRCLRHIVCALDKIVCFRVVRFRSGSLRERREISRSGI